MSKTIYYASPENMIAYIDGSLSCNWQEVVIVGTNQNKDGRRWLLVKTLDGSKIFTTNEEYIFTKTDEANL